eukprot:NODE_1844_length_1283_cov_45.773096_g1526_i0.p1 GENE.NODE_1844_length_1283_cov_45.773096_g1526_i0~~NODE_1844_length_1283_cov_45.773096_g1526_i0.p1  ORF type:complete len:323 (-),score=91.98 NODE_1844_length_1283_cov_45.773096_g1526_i0:110-1078(-)
MSVRIPTSSLGDEVAHSVRVSGLVVHKILKHAKETSPPQQAYGTLLGLDEDRSILDVTNCFPVPTSEDVDNDPHQKDNTEEEEANRQAASRDTILQRFKEVNIDSRVIGWYLVSWNALLAPHQIALQADYQLNYDSKAVCLIFDPLVSSQSGRLSFKAVRCRKQYLNALRKANQETGRVPMPTAEELSSNTILESVPLEFFQTTVLSEVFSRQLAASLSHVPPPVPSSNDQSLSTFCQRAISSLTGDEEELLQQMNIYHNAFRKTQQAYSGGAVMPTRMPILLQSRQMSEQCLAIESVSRQALKHLYLAEAMHNAETGEHED